MKIKYAYKKEPGDYDWYSVDGIKEICLVLRSGAEVLLTQDKEEMLPRTKIKRKQGGK